MDINELLKDLVSIGGSDLHIQTDVIPKIRVQGRIKNLNYIPLNNAQVKNLFEQLNPASAVIGRFIDNKQVDFRYTNPMFGRYRVNYCQCSSGLKLTMRNLNRPISSMEILGFDNELAKKLSNMERGLVLITGPTNSGKSTTLASLISSYKQKGKNIITLEDPIEYIQDEDMNCLVTQRELYTDFDDYPTAIKACLRQDPDIIMVGEMRDIPTIENTIIAAETGHLVFSTLHTGSVEETLNRTLMVFPSTSRDYMREVLKSTIKCIINQKLVYDEDLELLKLEYDYEMGVRE